MKTDLEYLDEAIEMVKKKMAIQTAGEPMQALVTELVLEAVTTVIAQAKLLKLKDSMGLRVNDN